MSSATSPCHRVVGSEGVEPIFASIVPESVFAFVFVAFTRHSLIQCHCHLIYGLGVSNLFSLSFPSLRSKILVLSAFLVNLNGKISCCTFHSGIISCLDDGVHDLLGFR